MILCRRNLIRRYTLRAVVVLAANLPEEPKEHLRAHPMRTLAQKNKSLAWNNKTSAEALC